MTRRFPTASRTLADFVCGETQWVTHEEQDKLLDFAAYRELISDWQGKETEDAVAVVNWVASTLQTELGRIAKIIPNCYARGRMDALRNSQMDFHVAGELSSILTPLVNRVLTDAYESRDIKFEPPFIFRKEEAVKVINGIVKTGRIPRGAKPNQNTSAAQNFGFGLKIVKKGSERELDTAENPHVRDIWNFIESKLTDDGQMMRVETLYKNFMGIGGPKDYGLTRRIVQIFLLCLVQQGRVRVGISPKSGLSLPLIDYSNIAQVEFTAKVLDSLTEVQKLAKPENWEVLRPYAERLLNEAIPSTHDDAIISTYRTRLRELFSREKDEASRVQTRSALLFEDLHNTNPYATELEQVVRLFSVDIETSNDINAILHAFKEVLGYQAFDSSAFSQTEVDDLANRLKNYRDLQRFIESEPEIRVINAYCSHELPNLPDLAHVLEIQKFLGEKIASPQTYIDSDVELKTELLGRIPPEVGETGTLGALVEAYIMREARDSRWNNSCLSAWKGIFASAESGSW